MMELPSLFGIVEKLASFHSKSKDERSFLSPSFLKKMMENRTKLYEKFSLRTKITIWEKYHQIFKAEVSFIMFYETYGSSFGL
jgi:hypothetical protein